MRTSLILLFAICSVVVANPSRRKRQMPFNPWAQAFSGAGFFPMPIPIPFPMFGTGAAVSTSTGTDTGNSNINQNYGWPNYGWPNYGFTWPTFNFPIPWYKGENVCVETRYANEPDAFKGFGDGVVIDGSYGQKSESCRGSSEAYVCRGRKTVSENGKEVTKQYMTKYQCCYGFVRPKDGAPGCIESANFEKPVVPSAGGTQSVAGAQSAAGAQAVAGAQSVGGPGVVQSHSASQAVATSGDSPSLPQSGFVPVQ